MLTFADQNHSPYQQRRFPNQDIQSILILGSPRIIVMNIKNKILGPQSKYDSDIPFSYEARIDSLDGLGDDETGFGYFYSDTLCAMIQYLRDEEISPLDVKIYAVYENKELPIDVNPMITEKGDWICRPHLCSALEKQYRTTLQPEYKGHHKQGDCSFDDRDDKRII